MNVKQIDAKDTYQLRNIVLRPNLPVKSCHFDHDKDESTFHLAAYIDDKLASIASFYMLNNDKLDDNFQYQLRGMATLVEYRAQGLSSALLRTAFPLIKKNHINTLWCNARSESRGFYEKVGFKAIGDEFNIDGVGLHFLMIKHI